MLRLRALSLLQRFELLRWRLLLQPLGPLPQWRAVLDQFGAGWRRMLRPLLLLRLQREWVQSTRALHLSQRASARLLARMQRRAILIVVAAAVAIAATGVAAGYGAGVPALLVVSALVVAVAQQSLP
jgi:hypothetical protein